MPTPIRPIDIFPVVDGMRVSVDVVHPGEGHWTRRLVGRCYTVIATPDPEDMYERRIAPLDVVALEDAEPGLGFQSCDAGWPPAEHVAFVRALMGLERFFAAK